MSRQILIEKAVKAINELPESKSEEINDFIEFIRIKYENETLNEDIASLLSNSKSFEFLAEEDDLYSLDDVKRK